MDNKTLCRKCGEWQSESEFCRRASGRLRKECKMCQRAYMAKWRATHPEYSRKWAAAHPAYQREYRAARLEERRNYDRERQAAYPEYRRAKTAQYRARKKGAPIVENIDKAYIFRRDKGRCHLCGKKVDPKDWHLDHLLALIKGGEHSYRNVAVAHPSCNMRKGAGRLPSQTRMFG